METGPDEVMAENYMTMAQSENCRLVDASIQKNISFDGKPVTPTSWNGGVGEIFSLRDQLKRAEEKASQVQREVWKLVAEESIIGSVQTWTVLKRFSFSFCVHPNKTLLHLTNLSSSATAWKWSCRSCRCCTTAVRGSEQSWRKSCCAARQSWRSCQGGLRWGTDIHNIRATAGIKRKKYYIYFITN